MKVFAQIVGLVGIIISGAYLYSKGYNFEGIMGLLASSGAFAATFFFSTSGSINKMNQTTGANSESYQAGRDINIKK